MEPISDLQFARFTAVIQDNFGIFLKEDKKEMLQIRLYKLMIKHNVTSYAALYNVLIQDRAHLADLSDAVTISKTSFFRESHHFDFLRHRFDFMLDKNPRIARNGEFRIWSSACSSGEEPYTMAMVLKEMLPVTIQPKVLATDINRDNITKATRGIYSKEIAQENDGYFLSKYFKRMGDGYQISAEMRAMVTFRLFNLMDQFPFKNPFDVIFCRNVMIYFDNNVQQHLIDKFYDALAPGGFLFIGHSESLTGKSHRFQYIEPTIYMK